MEFAIIQLRFNQQTVVEPPINQAQNYFSKSLRKSIIQRNIAPSDKNRLLFYTVCIRIFTGSKSMP